MAHSVELLFDEHTETTLWQIWRALADAGLPSQAAIRSDTNRPHVTVLVADRIGAGVDDGLAALADRLPLPCTIGAPLLFGGRRITLTRLIVPDDRLLALQSETYLRCADFVAPAALPHAEPGHWTPHVTLGRRLEPAELAAAWAVLGPWSADIPAQFTGVRRWDGDARVSHLLIGR